MTEDRVQSFGERRVRSAFNPSSNNDVDEIKARTAALIDLCQELLNGLDGHDEGGEVTRLLKLAQTHYEDAAMWAVKAVTA